MKKATFPIITKNTSGLLLVNREGGFIEGAMPIPTFGEKIRYYWGGLGWFLFNRVYTTTKMAFELPKLDITDGPIEQLSEALNSKDMFLDLKATPYEKLTEQEQFTLTLFENLYRDYHFDEHRGIETFADFNANPLYVVNHILGGLELSNNEVIRFALDSFVYELIVIKYNDTLSVQMKCLGVTNSEYNGIVPISDIRNATFLLAPTENGPVSMETLLDFGEVDQSANKKSAEITVNKQLDELGEGTIGPIAPGMSIREIFQKVNHSLKIKDEEPTEPKHDTTDSKNQSKDSSDKVKSGLGWDDIM